MISLNLALPEYKTYRKDFQFFAKLYAWNLFSFLFFTHILDVNFFAGYTLNMEKLFDML